MKIRYIGTESYQEYPVTGTTALWQPEWVSDVSNARATALVALGTFVYEDESTWANQLVDRAAELAAMGLQISGRAAKGTQSGTALDILGGTWTVAQTASAPSVAVSSAYSIATQPGVSPLVMTGTSTGASQYVRATKALPSSFTTRNGEITVPIFIPDHTKVAQIGILYSSDGFVAKNFATYYTPDFSGLHMVGLSNRIVQGVAGGQAYAATGSMGVEETITHFRVQMTLANTVTGTIAVGQPIVGARKKAQMMVAVDDGEAYIMRQLDAALPWSPYEYATRCGIKFSFFLIPALLNTAGYFTTADVQRIVADGHRVYPHGASSLASLADDAARRADIEANIAGLEALGIARSDLLMCYAYPNGVFEVSTGDTSIFQILIDKGFKLARCASRRAFIPWQCGVHRKYTMPILGYYENVGGGGETLAIGKAHINDLVVVGGLGIQLHHKFVVGTPTDTLETKQADFIEMCDLMVSHANGGALEFVTPHDLVDEYSISVPLGVTAI